MRQQDFRTLKNAVYTNNKHFYIESKKEWHYIIKNVICIRINLDNYIWDSYAENYKILMRDIKYNRKFEREILFMDLKTPCF